MRNSLEGCCLERAAGDTRYKILEQKATQQQLQDTAQETARLPPLIKITSNEFVKPNCNLLNYTVHDVIINNTKSLALSFS